MFDVTLAPFETHWTWHVHCTRLYRVNAVPTICPRVRTGKLIIIPEDIMRALVLSQSRRDVRAWGSTVCEEGLGTLVLASVAAGETAIASPRNIGRDLCEWLSTLSARLRCFLGWRLINDVSNSSKEAESLYKPSPPGPGPVKSCHKHP